MTTPSVTNLGVSPKDEGSGDEIRRIYDQLQFRHAWRPYQQRVLDAIDQHFRDRKLHVVAAPGSGKTTLGLEIFRRLGKPALVFSPTRTIRDQWIHRLKDFLPDSAPWPADWTSVDLSAPATFTSVTYQALHTQYRRDGFVALEEGEETDDPEPEAADALSHSEIVDLAAILKKAGIGTLILDEAHHLRAEWWKALSVLAEQLPSITIVSLTATPPYDVIGPEWSRYEELCGTIDEEISVPELVRTGTLCPHQDFVWTIVPLKNERQLVEQYDRAVARLCSLLLDDSQFETAIASHPWLRDAHADGEVILDHPETAIALLAFLKTKRRPLPSATMALLDLEIEDLPPLDRRWWQTLVKSYLFDNHWLLGDVQQQHRKELAQQMRADHLLWRHEVRLEESRLVKSRLTLSSAKIAACVDIHREERRLRGDGLRQLILTDFIRDKEIDGGEDGAAPLGAWPVFNALVRSQGIEQATDVALLTGRLVVVHNALLSRLRAATGGPALKATPLASLNGFSKVTDAGAHIVAAITALLSEGLLRTVVGTRSLLGEGWDAPVVNSLVLASFVGSFMTTNQMRGRAIRTDKTNPEKAASIWHIVAVAPKLESGLLDLGELASRFRTFVGLSEREASIESGIARLKLPYLNSYGWVPPTSLRNWSNNDYMVTRLRRINEIALRWKDAIEKGEAAQVTPTVKAVKPLSFAPIWFKQTLKYLLLQILATFILAFATILNGLQGGIVGGRGSAAAIVFLIAGGGATLYVLPRLIRAVWIWLRHVPVDGTVQQIALSVRDSLCKSDQILGSPRHFPVVTTKHEDGTVTIALARGSFYERSLFADCVNEVLGPIKNPRYLLTRYKGASRRGRADYHAVPQSLGARKADAEILLQAWSRRVGPTELIYVRGSEGRRALLRARSRAFSTAMQQSTERFDRWQ